MESPERGSPVAGIAMEFPASDGALFCTPPTMPTWLRRRLSEPKTPPLSTVEEIEAKLRDADLRRQKFYENLSSKARPKPRNPSRSLSHEDDLGHRLKAKLLAAEEKRLSILTNAQMRLAKLDELRQTSKREAEMRFKRERAELSTKVEMRLRQAEANRLLILRASCQRRATLTERASLSLMQRMARESKYEEGVRDSICQKRAAAEKKRLGLLEAKKRRACTLALQKFYDNLSSKVSLNPRNPSRSLSHEDDLGQRLKAKLIAAEEKRLSILTNAQMRLAKLDEFRHTSKREAEMRFKRERAELSKKVEMRLRQAEANRLRILRATSQRRATQKERASLSLMRRMAGKSKYEERVRDAICQKRAAAEKKRLGLLEAKKRRARALALQVQKVANHQLVHKS